MNPARSNHQKLAGTNTGYFLMSALHVAALIDVDLEDGVEVVGCDHLTSKANDDYEFLIVEQSQR